MDERRTVHTSDIANQENASRPAPADEPISRVPRDESDTETATDTEPPLLPAVESTRLQERWEKIQAGFVDEPRQMVEEADALVAEVMQQLAVAFADARRHLEEQWTSGDDVSTEDLRRALTRYRSFFRRLLAA